MTEATGTGVDVEGGRSGRTVVVVSALGMVEILAWGSSYYLPAVLAAPIVADTGWPPAWIVGGLSIGLLTSALVSPQIGLFIGRHGGRPVLALAAVLLALGLSLLGSAPTLPIYLIAWAVLGLGMGTGLYDPAYATLGRLYGSNARRAITALSLFGGFASTVCWPLSAYLVARLGWRGACFAYAGLHLTVTLPLVLNLVPKASTLPDLRRTGCATIAMSRRDWHAYLLYAMLLVGGGLITSIVSVHLLTLLEARGVAPTAAISFGALFGPAQVGARLLEMASKGRHHPLWTLTAAILLITLGMASLATGHGAVAAAVVLYGAGSGILSIARGTVPLALFGPERYAPLVGRLARWSLTAQALAPPLAAYMLRHGGANATFALLIAVMLGDAALVAALWFQRRATKPAAVPAKR